MVCSLLQWVMVDRHTESFLQISPSLFGESGLVVAVLLVSAIPGGDALKETAQVRRSIAESLYCARTRQGLALDFIIP